MTTDNDLINSLGLGLGATAETTAAPSTEASTALAEETVDRAKRTEIKIAKPIVKKQAALLPVRTFGAGGGGKRGSKYPFDTLEAPTKDEAGNVTGYDYFEVLLDNVENADQKKLQTAVTAAVANANKAAKAEYSIARFVSRTVLGENEEYVGTAVYRVDDTIGDDED